MPAESQTVQLRFSDLKDYFISGCKKPDELTLGVEWEKLGVYRDSGAAIPYSGPRGVEAVLRALAREYRWQPVFSKKHIIALQKPGRSITLEPGGQIELSGQNAPRLEQNAQELYSHLEEIKAVSEDLGIAWLALGAQPFSIHEGIEWVPKERYAIMRESLKDKGTRTYSMMKESAAVQVSLDYTHEADAVQKFRLAMALSPILTAVFANSPFEEGRVTEFLSRRAHIWARTDPDRTGILWQVFDAGFRLDDYVEYALSVPCLFIQRSDRWIRIAKPMTFRDYLDNGFESYQATESDWELHLSSIFTEARFKKYIEIRSIDCQKPALGLAAAAFLKGLFYHDASREAAWRLLAPYSISDRKKLKMTAPKTGLQSLLGNQAVGSVASKLLQLAKEGLKEEAAYLGPLEELLEQGASPAERLLARLRNAKKPVKIKDKILEWCAI